MSDTARGAVRMDKSSGIGGAEAAENQRKWDKAQTDEHNATRAAKFYDWSRRELNFAVLDGKICKQGEGGTITARMNRRLSELGYDRDYAEKVGQKPVMKFVLSGNAELMRQLAFGDQKVSYRRDGKADNSSVVRQKAIEQWALDCYNWIAKTYGERNIVGCDVHLDESSPHMHISIIPTGMVAKGGRPKKGEEGKPRAMKEVVSMSARFGEHLKDGAEIRRGIHTAYFEVVGKKYGLARGVEGSDARHKDIDTWYREKVAEVKQLETKEKGLRTMIANLEKLKAQLLKEVADGRTDVERKLKEVEDKINDKQEKLGVAQNDLDKAKAELDDVKQQLSDSKIKLAKGVVNKLSALVGAGDEVKAKEEARAARKAQEQAEAERDTQKQKVAELQRQLKTEQGKTSTAIARASTAESRVRAKECKAIGLEWLLKQSHCSDWAMFEGLDVYNNGHGWHITGQYGGVNFHSHLGNSDDDMQRRTLADALAMAFPWAIEDAKDEGMRFDVARAYFEALVATSAVSSSGGGGGSSSGMPWRDRDEDELKEHIQAAYNKVRTAKRRQGPSR